MSKAIYWILGTTAAILFACILLGVGFILGQTSWITFSFWPPAWMSQMMTYSPTRQGFLQGDRTPQPGYGWMGGSGMMGSGMMGGYSGSGTSLVEPLSIEEANQALERFLEDLGNSDLEVKEVMIFTNHAYAEIIEKSSGIGAMEVLVDPVTRTVYPEHGPNMMWNLKYSPMGSRGFGMMGGMMGGYYRPGGAANPPEVSPEMTVSPEAAITAAQMYLDTYYPGITVEEHVDPFYGYYTLHTLRDGKVIGMLSVNGFSAAVFPHTWHGDFIEMSEDE